MNENLLRHALWAWAIFHFGWEPGSNAAGELAAFDLWQRLEVDVWTEPLHVLLERAVERARGRDLVVGLYEGALRIQRTKPISAADALALILHVRRGGRWHGLGMVSSYEAAASLLSGQARPRLGLVRGNGGDS